MKTSPHGFIPLFSAAFLGAAAAAPEKNAGSISQESAPASPAESVDQRVFLDVENVDILWRVNYGFHSSVLGGRDSDGDGRSDAEEAAAWTDPLIPDKYLPSGADIARMRREVSDFCLSKPLLLD